MKVRVSSGSIKRLIDVVFHPVNKHQKIKNLKKKRVHGKVHGISEKTGR